MYVSIDTYMICPVLVHVYMSLDDINSIYTYEQYT